MAKDWGIKITKPGVAATTTDPREMLLSSKYQMFKYHGVYDTSATFNPGDKTATVSVTHGLGYVPAFLPYVYDPITAALEIIPNYPYGIGFDTAIQAWADTTKIYFRVAMGLVSGAGWNELLIVNDEYYTNYAPYDGYPYFYLGNSALFGTMESAVRFPSVPVTSSVSIASAEIKVKPYVKDGTGRLKWDTKGVDVDNLDYFFTTNPFSLPPTTANTYKDISVPAEVAVNNYISVDVTSQLNEIRARGGWSSGDPMGFTMRNNGTTGENYFAADYINYDTYLRILLAGTTTYSFRAVVFKDKVHA